MKKVLLILLSVLLLFALAACGSNEAATEESADTASKTLVVYFSATGNTAEAAGYITEALAADSFEIVPAQPYTEEDLNYNDSDSRVFREHNDPALREVELTTATPDGWEEYDTVFIGYPIWWGIAAWPVDSFVKANDFAGKTVIPFCTSASSDLGESVSLLKEAAAGGDWLDGRRFASGVSADEVQAWITSLDLK